MIKRGKSFVMLSLIMKKEYESESVYAFLVDSSYKILKTENVYKAFYKFDDFRDDSDIEIDLTYEQIKKILFNCLTSLISRIEDKVKGVNKKSLSLFQKNKNFNNIFILLLYRDNDDGKIASSRAHMIKNDYVAQEHAYT